MQLRRRVALDNVQLDGIDNRIIVCGVEEGEPKINLSTVSRFGAPGQRITSRHRDYLDVTVKFAMQITKRALEQRSELFEKVTGWAAPGGWLKLNYKPNRRLGVVCAGLPAADDPAKWDTEYSIVFRACAVPYWQQVTPATMTINSTKSLSRSMEIAGTADSVLDVQFTNTSGMEINTLSVSTDQASFAFKSLGLTADETLVIDHSNGLLRIRIKSAAGSWRSAMGKRTPESSDDLAVRPGAAAIRLTAQRAGRLELACYGRYE